jgi:hypothetical protein
MADDKAIAVNSNSIGIAGIQIPGATPGGIQAQLLNIDQTCGIIATIIHFKAGSSIPAHSHGDCEEAHYVLEGDFINAGRTFGPGAYLTHAVGVVHGPHSSEGGCKILTIQSGKIVPGNADFILAAPSPGVEPTRHSIETSEETKISVPPDMAHEPVSTADVPESQKLGPTPDNPTNPTTG